MRKRFSRPWLGRAWIGLIFFLAALANGLRPLSAQDAAPAIPLASIAEINRTLTDPSRTAAAMMRFRGTVIFISRGGDFCLQEGDAGLMMEPPATTPRPNMGDLIEIEAPIKYYGPDINDQSFMLAVPSVRNLGNGPMPEPIKSSLPTARNGEWSGRWVEVEGVLIQSVLENGVLGLHMTDDLGWAMINVHDWRGGGSIQDWWGARLRIRCANVGKGVLALRATSRDQITIVKPGLSDPFSAPLGDVEAIRSGSPTMERLRLIGTVIRSEKNGVYLRAEEGGGLWASYLRPWRGPTPNPSPLELTAPVLSPVPKPGDRLELVGSPLTAQPYVGWSYSVFRMLGPGEVPQPRRAAGEPLPAICGDLVTLTGKLQAMETNPSGADPAPKLTLDYGGTPIEVKFEASGPQHLASFLIGDGIEATGLLAPEENGHPYFLHVADGSALRLVGSVSLSRSLGPMAWRLVTGLTVGLAVALSGAWWLQRQVRHRTTDLAVSNAALREEVVFREKAEAGLAEALAQERDLSELKSRFVSTVSHEFRTPLGITMSAIELLRHYEDRLPQEEKTQLFDDIHTATKNMAGLMEQVLVLGRVDAGKLPYKPAPLNIDALARKLTDEALSATNRKCPIEWTAENDLSGAHADEALLRHIFTNLLSNGVKYSPAGATVHFRARREGLMVVFTLQDSGIGIPEKDLPELFEAFHRGTNVGDIPGTGLGLVISKRCVDLHGGSIQVKSLPGEGTTFTVRIPAW